jgi:hypothetical protein
VGGAAPITPLASFDANTLLPGSSVTVQLARGDYSIAAAGTVTYRDGEKIYAFGTPVPEPGRRGHADDREFSRDRHSQYFQFVQAGGAGENGGSDFTGSGDRSFSESWDTRPK